MKKQINPNIKVSTKDQDPNIKVSTKSQTPNILLIIADDLGQDVVNITGSGTTRAMQVHTYDDVHKKIDIYGALPNISRILRNGLYFSQAWAQPACSPTRASIFTGWHPWKNGVGNPTEAKLDSAKGFTTLPIQLKTKGYVSGLFGKWHLGSVEVDGTLPTDHGWDKHLGTLEGVLTQGLHNNYTDWYIHDSDDDNYGDSTYVGEHTNKYATWKTVYEAAIWINAQSSATPWFATIAFHSPHVPYHVPPSGYDAATAGIPTGPTSDEDLLNEDVYKDYKFNIMAQNMDWHIGSLLGIHSGSSAFKGIDEARLSNTIIIFIGDNGSDTEVALEEEKNYIYEGSVRVPMIIADGQAVVKEIKAQVITPRFLHANKLGKTDKWQMAHVVDLYKTIVRLVDPSASGFGDTHSKDFSDVVKSPLFTLLPGALKRTYNFSQYYKGDTKRATIRNSSYKLNYDAEADQVWALYKYSGGEIPGREDVADTATDTDAADDVLTDAISGKNAEAQTNLNLLHGELKNYRTDDVNTQFPALPKK